MVCMQFLIRSEFHGNSKKVAAASYRNMRMVLPPKSLRLPILNNYDLELHQVK